MSSPLSILLELPNGRRGLVLSVCSALSRATGIVLVAEALVRAIVGHSAPGLWVVLGILGALLRGGGLWLDRRLGASLAAESKRDLRAGILGTLLRGRGRPKTTTAVTVTRGIDDLDDYFTTVVPALSAAAVVPVVLLVRIVFSDVLSAVIIAVCLPLVPVFMVLIGRYTAESTRETLGALERLSDHLAELAEGLPVLIGLGRSRDHARRLRELGQRYHDANLSTLRIAFLSSLALELIATISVALVAVVIGLRLVNGTMVARLMQVRLSVGRTGVCWDNAVAEAFFASLKNEMFHRQRFVLAQGHGWRSRSISRCSTTGRGVTRRWAMRSLPGRWSRSSIAPRRNHRQPTGLLEEIVFSCRNNLTQSRGSVRKVCPRSAAMTWVAILPTVFSTLALSLGFLTRPGRTAAE